MRKLAFPAACVLVATGCTVGPDFRAPDPPATDRYVQGALPVAPGMPRLSPERDIPAQWWAVFGSVELDALVHRALRGNPTLDQARARLLQAQELRSARAGATEYPRFDLTAGAERQRIDPATFGFPQAPNPGPFNVWSLGVTAAYHFDIFGGTRRELEALGAQVDYQAYELEAARLTLASNVVATAIRRAALIAQADVTERIAAAQRRELAIAEERYRLGGVAWLTVQNLRALVAQTEAGLPALRAQAAQAGHQLAVLLGEPPATAVLPGPSLASFELPAELPLRVPSELVRQRPDIRASEALLHQASANVGVATADLYPKLVISGGFSSSQLNAGDLLGNGINIWNIGVNLLQPLLRGGELQARKRAAEAAYQQALAEYRQTVLLGLQNVADTLRALEGDALAVALRSEQAANARESQRITLELFRAGGVSEVAVLDAERQSRAAEVELLAAQAARLADAAALFQAMGGGWTAASAAQASGGEAPRSVERR
ncbi:MAG: efflux transporter outer membrane subunit [Burkholderiales bacterium]|nr:efflux transporter outer membrane subunit [Burkholderiales bacterium]